jgi:hypothetical protein
MRLITNKTLFLPQDVFPCPICGAQLYVDADTWEEADDGGWQLADGGCHLECTTEPDLDDDDWEEWHKGHYSMPYVDWLPLELEVLPWINARYRWQLSAEDL